MAILSRTDRSLLARWWWTVDHWSVACVAMLIAAGVLLAGFQVVLILQANSIQASNSFAQMGDLVPSFAREILGSSFVAFLTFKGIVCLGYFHPVVMGALVSVSLTLATIPVMEIETGFIDLVLARPVARHWIVTRSILVALISTVYLLAMMAIGTWIGLNDFAAKDAGWAIGWPHWFAGNQSGASDALLERDCAGDRLRLPAEGFRWSPRRVAGADGVPHRLHRACVETGGIGRVAFAVSVLHAF